MLPHRFWGVNRGSNRPAPVGARSSGERHSLTRQKHSGGFQIDRVEALGERLVHFGNGGAAFLLMTGSPPQPANVAAPTTADRLIDDIIHRLIYWPNSRGWAVHVRRSALACDLSSRELRHLLSSRRRRRSDRAGSSWTTRSDRSLVGVKLRSQASPNRRRKSARSGWTIDDLRSAARAKSLRSASNRSRPFAVLAA